MSTVVYDSEGKAHTLVLTMQKTATDEWTVADAELAGDPDATPPVPAVTLDDAIGIQIGFNNDGTLTGTIPGGATTLTLSGGAAANSGVPTEIFAGSNGDVIEMTLDFEDLTQYGGSTTAAVSDQDGQAAGQLIGYGIDPSGTLSLNFSNGEQRSIAQIAIGTVNNPNGLEQLGENFYGVTSASGDLTIGRAGQEVSTAVISGALETSNVDLANEFTDMIVTQRGYQASARVITTSDELLQEVVQLKR
jgi:flagellar hook protein FlgE